jgi:hypothetical protein
MIRQPQTFALDIARWAEAFKADVTTLVSTVAIEALSRIVLRTPVGNPELWAKNKATVEARANYNSGVQRDNAFVDTNPLLLLKYGKLKKKRTLSAKTIARRLPLPAGKGYVGGKARGNWHLDVGALKRSYSETVIDANGAATIGAGIDALSGYVAGKVIYIANSTPYVHRLEFDSWSSQAPAGMVRVTLAELVGFIDGEARRLAAKSQ